MGTVPGGTKLGRYEVVKALGSGPMAELLLARTGPTERPVLLKYIRPEHAIDGAFRDAFLDQARRAVQVRHPNVVEVHEVGREDGTTFLAMEYVHGEDVRKLLARLHERRAKLPVQHILAIITAVCAGVHHAHEQRDAEGQPLGLLHLDIRPSNVLIATDGTVKIGDFGLVRAALTESRTDLLGAVAGYLSPELVSGHAVDRRSDVFGIGILMYELATGRRLFKGDNDFLTLSAIVAGDIPPPSRNRGDLPKELEALILKALARAPEDRFASAGELGAALEKFAAKAGVRGSLTTLAGYMKRLFGTRLEPWLVTDDPTDLASTSDFDGAPRGIAMPPVEAMQNAAIPDSVTATGSSPIRRVLKVVAREMPTEQLTLAKIADKSVPVKIPAAVASGRVKAPTRVPITPVTPVPAARVKPKTVQIPVVVPDKGDKITREDSASVAKLPAPPITPTVTPTVPSRPPVAAADPDTDHEHDTVVGDEFDDLPPTVAPTLRPPALAKPSPRLPGVSPANGKAAKPTPRVFTEDTVRASPEILDELNGKHVALPPRRNDSEHDTFEVPTKPNEDAPGLDERTAVANPPPMPLVIASRTAEISAAREATAIVTPLPRPITADAAAAAAATPSRRRMWMAAGLAGVVLAAIVGVIGFSGNDPAPRASASAKPTPDEPLRERETPRTPRELDEEAAAAEGLRTADTPRTPRELAAQAADGSAGGADAAASDEGTPATAATEPVPPPTPDAEDTKGAPEPAAPTPEAEPELAVVEPPVDKPEPEPIDPAPPLDEPPAKKPIKAKPAPKAAAKRAKPARKPAPVATKPAKKKPAPKRTTKAAAKPKWDPNALFPQ